MDCWAVRDVTHVRQFVNTREQQPQLSYDNLTRKERTAQYGQSVSEVELLCVHKRATHDVIANLHYAFKLTLNQTSFNKVH
jgi:hypothetical protein